MRSHGMQLSLAIVVSVLSAHVAPAQQTVTTPVQEFGFAVGDDYQLASYRQLTAYWKKLEQESDRMYLEEIGRTAEGRTMLMAVISSPPNLLRVNRYKEISRKLALAEGMTDEQARELVSEGKAVVWIDGGIHATEVVGAQQLIELVYQMVSGQDPETLRFLDDVILLVACANPDGMDLVADWYMRDIEPSKRSLSHLPRLYQKYVGHDNNRDFYLVSQPETEAISRILYREWFPQIGYNHHQSGPRGTVLFAPPFRDPFNYNLDPLVPLGVDLIGSAMHNRFVVEGKGGATRREGASYSTWWNGGLRTTQYFHNMIGLLTETIGSPNPIEIPLVLRRQLPQNDLPFPIPPQKWHFRQSIEYSLTANRAVLDIASRYRETFLFNIYRMGKNSIDRGSRDHWTVTPQKLAAVAAAAQDEKGEEDLENRSLPAKLFEEVLRAPESRDPRGYILPSSQPDFLTAIKFINSLFKSGITVHRAMRDFEVGGRPYPVGSFVVKTAQAFRPHVLDMFEPQDHPHDFRYPGGPPIAPYDSAGWTLALQMGVEFDRVLEAFDGPFEPITQLVGPGAGQVRGDGRDPFFLLDSGANDAFRAVNRLLARRHGVRRMRENRYVGERFVPAGTFVVEVGPATLPQLRELAAELGLDFTGVPQIPADSSTALRPMRIGLYDQYGGSIPSGWIRWILEQFEFPYQLVFPLRLDEGELIRDFDVLIFAGRSIPAVDRTESEGAPEASPHELIPEEFHHQLGRVTSARTVPQLELFLKRGGTILAIGPATGLAYHLNLPIRSPMVERTSSGEESPLPRNSFYVPGSILRNRVHTLHPIAFGMPPEVAVYFSNSPVFALLPEASLQGIRPVAWFDVENPLRSGWAWGQHRLHHAVTVLEAPIGSGHLVLFGPEITFRAQPHGTFKLLFNGIYRSPAGVLEPAPPE